MLEYCSTVWHSSLTESDSKDIERIQKASVKIIMGNRYSDYNNSLKFLKLESLEERRSKLCLNFAKKCLRIEKSKSFFPINKNNSKNTRHFEKYKVNHANTKRYQKSSIINMQTLLNSNEAEKRKFFRTICVCNAFLYQ